MQFLIITVQLSLYLIVSLIFILCVLILDLVYSTLHILDDFHLIFMSYPSDLSDHMVYGQSIWFTSIRHTQLMIPKLFPQPTSLKQKHTHTVRQIASFSIKLNHVQNSAEAIHTSNSETGTETNQCKNKSNASLPH